MIQKAILGVLFLIAGTASVFPQAQKPVKSLKDIDVLASAAGNWKGVGIGFDIENDELKEPQSFRDDWSANFKAADQTFEMKGLIIRGRTELPYSWKFDFNGNAGNITASYEMGSNQKGILGVKVIAEGKRIQLAPIPDKSEIDMKIDIYFEEADLVIETEVRNAAGELVYRSATRYQKISDQ